MRTTRTLRLHREPLAVLDGGELRHVVGGLTLRDHCSPTFGTCLTEAPRCQWAETFDPNDCLTLRPCL